MTGARVALTLCALGGQTGEDKAVAALEVMYQALGFKNCLRRVAKAQSFQKELADFRELLDAHGSPISCALVVLLAHSECRGSLLGPDGREVQEKELVEELSHCQALWGKAKVFLLLGSHNTDLESNAFLPILTDHCRHFPHWHLLEVLTQVIGEVTQEMPTTTGHRCPIFQSSLRGALYFGRTRSQDLELSPIPQGVYDMSGEKVALVLCVTQDRLGAEQDLKGLKRLFQTLGFKSILKMDPTAQDFRKELAQFREHLDACRTTVSCALIALMAHGEPQGRLLGADGQIVEVEEMVRELSACQVLQGKAKIFLLQGCRGDNRDPGVRPRAWPWLGRWLQHWLQRPSTIPSHADILRVYANMQDVSSREDFPRNTDQVDILRVYSAAEGYVAYRDENGSDFIQTLVEVITADPHQDLLELLTEVNRQLCEMDVLGPDCDEIRKMNLEIRSSLRKRLYLKV
ncbi:caspase-14-like isoform X1 [Phascolarctos cinereus]|uniref:Caspase-14-like isoform X1 n=1 Tax=Phascolarctos cinereus TaxID=38626 RepID=A0A6P5L0V6_PHACI|nr:caspase-14-like isoform X1 [Phascolarctos cinereus]XP_020851337.1 caspase-14-like isoform X1 [Phascolarctos cinereus]